MTFSEEHEQNQRMHEACNISMAEIEYVSKELNCSIVFEPHAYEKLCGFTVYQLRTATQRVFIATIFFRDTVDGVVEFSFCCHANIETFAADGLKWQPYHLEDPDDEQAVQSLFFDTLCEVDELVFH